MLLEFCFNNEELCWQLSSIRYEGRQLDYRNKPNATPDRDNVNRPQ
jgi:hypothetical protein